MHDLQCLEHPLRLAGGYPVTTPKGQNFRCYTSRRKIYVMPCPSRLNRNSKLSDLPPQGVLVKDQRIGGNKKKIRWQSRSGEHPLLPRTPSWKASLQAHTQTLATLAHQESSPTWLLLWGRDGNGMGMGWEWDGDHHNEMQKLTKKKNRLSKAAIVF